MAIIKCPECGHQVSDQAKTCPSCGIDIAGKVMKCPECGEIIFKHQELCPNCHCALHAPQEPKQEMVVADKTEQETPRHVEATPVAAGNGTGPKRKKKRGWLGLVVAFVIALLAVCLGFYFYKDQMKKNEIAAYENAMSTKQPEVMQSYLNLYPNAPADHVDAIMEKLDEIRRIEREWQNAAASGSKTEILAYLKKYPDTEHADEAKVKIDSIDWVAAQEQNTQDSYEEYMTQHQQGEHYDEARALLDKLLAALVSPEDRQMISSLFRNYFNGLAAQDETGIIGTITNVLTSFLHKVSATPSDVITYMKKIHEAADITDMKFNLRNDWNIDKIEEPDGTYSFKVNFTVDQQIVRTDPNKEKAATYKVSAKVSPSGKISELNMTKIVNE